MRFHVKITERARRELNRIPVDRRYRLLKGLKQQLKTPTGRLRRLRIGDYRIFFEVAGEEVYVLRCVHRQTPQSV